MQQELIILGSTTNSTFLTIRSRGKCVRVTTHYDLRIEVINGQSVFMWSSSAPTGKYWAITS
jgi:hypothetical protein